MSEANDILLAGESLFHELFLTGLRSKCQTTKLYCCVKVSASCMAGNMLSHQVAFASQSLEYVDDAMDSTI